MISSPEKIKKETKQTLSQRLDALKDHLEREPYKHLDLSVKPTDDFYRFISGSWLKTFQIPEDKSSMGCFLELRDKLEEDVQVIMDDLLSKKDLSEDERRIINIYKSYMDEEKIEQLALDPILWILDKIEEADSKEALVKTMGFLYIIGIPLPFSLGVGIDDKVDNAYVIKIGQSGLTMPDKDYYFNEDPKFEEYRNGHHQYLETLMTLANQVNPQDRLKSILSIEQDLAHAHRDKVASLDPEKTYNKVTFDTLKQEYGLHFDWSLFNSRADIPTFESCVVRQPEALKQFDSLFGKHSLEDWKTYLTSRVIHNFAAFLPKAFQDARFEFYGKVLNGQEKPRPRSKRALSVVDATIGELLGKLYVEKHFPDSSKQRVLKMIQEIKEAFKEGIIHNDWMCDKTKAMAIKKLEDMRIKIGFPDKWKDYELLEFTKDKLIYNIIESESYKIYTDLQKLNQPIDKTEFLMLPHTVNAYNLPSQNEICFPAAILQAPFFDENASDAQNYGAIGAVIGHEISHGFDDQGRQYDERGQLKDWWSEEDTQSFEERVSKLVEQYNAFEPLPGAHVNGKLTLGENIADLTGITMAYKAYQRAHKSHPEEIDSVFSAQQVLLMSFGNVWRAKYREDALRNRVKTDPHSPGEYRCNGVMSNLKQFYKHFAVKEGDKMYKPEEDRVNLWFKKK